MSEITPLEKLQYCNNEIHNEFNILAMRSTILVTCQSFLVVPFALLQTGPSYPKVAVYAYIIALLGIFTALVIIQPLRASHVTIDKWMLKKRSLLKDVPELEFFSSPRYTQSIVAESFMKDPLHRKSLAFSIYGPRVFVVFWVFMCVWSTTRLFWNF